MPLKPIFDKGPLIALKELPLRPGQVRTRNEKLEQLYTAAAAMGADQPLL